MKLYPSKEIYDYFKGNITSLQVVCYLSDSIAGFGISYSAKELLKSLNLLSEDGKRVNKQGKLALSAYLHYEYHKSTEPLIIVHPVDGEHGIIFTGETYNITGRGTVYSVILKESLTPDEARMALLGKSISLTDGTTGTITGIEMFASNTKQSTAGFLIK